MDQVFNVIGHVARSWSFSLPILVLLSFFLISVDSVVYPDSLYIAISRYSFSVFIRYHMWTSICSIAVILILHIDYITCSVTLSLACIHGYFHHVYTSPTLVATPFPRILRSGAWHWLCGYINCKLSQENTHPLG